VFNHPIRLYRFKTLIFSNLDNSRALKANHYITTLENNKQGESITTVRTVSVNHNYMMEENKNKFTVMFI
jgi:hypothetical protein